MIISIHLDGNTENIFYAGQNITGHVRVDSKDEIKMRGIRLELHGDVRVHWTEGSGRNKRSYTCTQTVLNTRMYLIGAAKDSEMTLKSGVQTFPLAFVLPAGVPSTFQGYFGYVKYRVKAVVDRVMRIDDSTEIPITVIRTLNLNQEPPEVKGPVLVHEEEPMAGCCVSCCCIKGLPEMELKMNKGGFVPGETIVLSGQVNNKSNTKIKRTTINFLQEIEYIVMNKNGVVLRRKFQYNTLGTTKRSKLESGKTDSWSDVTFPVPAVPASRLDGCSIINITYCIQVKVDFDKGCCSDSAIRRDVVIGHIPIQGDTQFGGPITTQPTNFASPFQYGLAPAPAAPQQSMTTQPANYASPFQYGMAPAPAAPQQSDYSGVHGPRSGWD